MFNSTINGPIRSQMVSGEEIVLDIYSNSQNFGRAMANGPTFTTFKPTSTTTTSTKPSAAATTKSTKTTANNKPDKQTTTSKGQNGGIVHLGTKIISDDVPPKNYDGLKSESVISLNNVSTFPSKRPAPVIEKKDQKLSSDKNAVMNGHGNINNGFDDHKIDNVSSHKHHNPLPPSIDLPSNKKYQAPPPPPLNNPTQTSQTKNSEAPKIQIADFERGKLPSMSKKNNQSQPEFVPSTTPLVTNSPPGSNIKLSEQIPVSSSNEIRRSNFQIGLPTILPVSYKTGIKITPPTPVEDDAFVLDPILKAPDEFSDEQIKTKNLQNMSSFQNPWKESNKTTNSLIRPFKLKPQESVRPVEFSATNVKEIDSLDGMKNIDLIAENKFHEHSLKHSEDGRSMNESSGNEEILKKENNNIPRSERDVKKLSSDLELSKTTSEKVKTKALNNKTPSSENKFLAKSSLNEVDARPKKIGRKSPRLDTKPQLEIPPNDFIKNKNFRNHLEGIIAKSSPMKTKSPRKHASNQLQDGQVRKYKFLVEGIDVPKGTFTENRSDSDEKEFEDSTSNAKREMRGFSYLMNKEQAEEITLKAAEVTARRPHESVESFAIEREIISNSRDDNDVLRQARANLHAQITEMRRKSDDSPDSPDSPDVKEGVKKNGDHVHGWSSQAVNNKHKQSETKSEDVDHQNGSKVEQSNNWQEVNTDRHNIPHDTSRIFLRPHGEDMEQLKKLKEERFKSLSRKNQYSNIMAMEDSIETPNPNFQEISSDSNPTSNQELDKGRRYIQSRNGSSSSIMTLKQAKLKSRKKANAQLSSNQTPSHHHDLLNNSNHVDASRLVHTGERIPVESAAEQAMRKPHHTPNIMPHRVSDDENSVHSSESVLAGSLTRSYKQRRYRHKKKSNSKLDPKQRQLLLDSSEYSDNDSFILYRNLRHNISSKNNEPASFKNFDSEPEIIDSRKYLLSRNADSQRYLSPNTIQIRQTDRIVTGRISVPPPSLKQVKLVKGELTLPERPKTEPPQKVRTLSSLGVSVYGPGVHYKILDDQVSNPKTSTLPPNARNFNNINNNNNNNNANYFVPLNDIHEEYSSKEYRIKKNFMNSLARSMPALDPPIIDPELKKINQKSGQYRVQMKLSAFNPNRYSSLSGMMFENNHRGSVDNNRHIYNDVIERESRNILSRNYATPVIPPPSYINPPHNNPIRSTSVQITPNENIHKSRINDVIDDNWDSYAIKSITPTLPAKIPQPSTIEFDLELLNTGHTKLDTYSVEQSRPTNQYNDIASRKVNRIPQDSMLLMRDQIHPQNYSDDIPNVIRGSILIRNSLDKNTSRRYLDLVDRNGSNGKQDNNLFHGRYFQNRENPLYASDLETIEHGRNVKRMINDRRTERLPDIAMEWDETDGQKRNVPIKKEWYYDHIWNSRSSPVMQNKGGAWKLKSRMEEKRGNHRQNYSTNSSQHVRQSIDVKREEEELIGPLQGEDVQRVEENLNVDAISEKVELSLSDGIVTIEVRVRCERLVPIRGTNDMFRKSAVVVTRKIEIDMTVTQDRKAMYDTAVAISKKQNPSDPNDNYLRLSTKDTFELYCKLMEIADEAGDSQEGLLFGSLHIDKELEEETRVPFGATSPEVLITEDDLLSTKTSSAFHKRRSRHS